MDMILAAAIRIPGAARRHAGKPAFPSALSISTMKLRALVRCMETLAERTIPVMLILS
jgi:hypothetical protein